jgi:hypothetical protein
MQKNNLPMNEFIQTTAHLSFEDTGIPGTIRISTSDPSVLPQIKWFKGSTIHDADLIMSISDKPVVKSQIKNEPVAKISSWVSSNHEELLNFWNHGHYWTHHEVNMFVMRLKKCK